MITRIKSPIIYRFEPLCSILQLVVEMENDRAVDSYIEYLKDTVYALRLRRKECYLERHNDYNKMPTFTIPMSINNSIESLEHLANYVNKNIQFNFEDGYGAIISSPKNSSRKFVSLAIPHIFADGQYFTFLIDHFLNAKSQNTLKGLPSFPIPLEDVYNDFYLKAPNNVKDEIRNEKLTRFFSNDKSNLKSGDFCEFITLHLNPSEMKNKVTINNITKVSNFTELLYMSNYFAICAHENKLLNSFGVINIVDLKKFAKKPPTFANCFEISSISPFTDHITSDMKIIDVGKNLRKSINEKLNNLEQFSGVLSKPFNQKLPVLKGIATEFTNVGEVHIKKPIIDLWMSISTKCLDRELVSNMGFSVIRDDFASYKKEERCNKNMNDLVLRYRYSPRKMSFNESKKMANTIEYFLKNISFNERVGNAFDEIKKFYNSI